jgi:hypothetical protein
MTLMAQRSKDVLSRLILTIALAFNPTIATVAAPQQDSGPVSVELNKPLYEQALELLNETDKVVPPTLDVHPFSALYNREAIVPPQCYTKTEGRYNPCYVCHQNTLGTHRENSMNDLNLQQSYSFSDVALKNHWSNLFEDRSEQVLAISDTEIRAWVSVDNYQELSQRLRDANFQGWIPDLKNLALGAGAFDRTGQALDGSDWVAFNYKPVPSTFWPTNGSTDDVMIRLETSFRVDSYGVYSKDIYRANLSILEASIKGFSAITTIPIDERAVKQDLNDDGKLGVITRITRLGAFVGAAADIPLQPGIYPRGTEFLHTVRYLGFGTEKSVTSARRMKEVRYMQKITPFPKLALAQLYREEQYAKDQGYLPSYVDLGPRGLYNGMGWVLQGFIEDKKGRLRANTFEETMFCMGCHTSIGSTIDKTFSFPRKVDGAAGWKYIDLQGMPDAPNQGEEEGEIATYLERVGGGGEFRNNAEMQARWFHADGTPDKTRIKAAQDVYELIVPSVQRALHLNKAYKVLLQDQDFLYGRDATALPPSSVYQTIDNSETPTLAPQHIYTWDIQLDWQATQP